MIENSIICGITALQDSITHHDISTIKSYLKALKLPVGLAVNFGKSKLEIKGVRHYPELFKKVKKVGGIFSAIYYITVI